MGNIVNIQNAPVQGEQYGFTEEEIRQMKNLICKGIKDEEFPMFLRICARTGLDPFAKQIYAIPRGGQMTIQVSIDGSRLIAERTKRYAPGREPIYARDDHGNLVSATSFVKKQTPDGTWHEVAATAYFSEYNPNTQFWKKMPHVMLAKCAEQAALRKAFPSELAGLYVKEEMDQAGEGDIPPLTLEAEIAENEKISMEQAEELREAFRGMPDLWEQIAGPMKIKGVSELPANKFLETLTRAQTVRTNRMAVKK